MSANEHFDDDKLVEVAVVHNEVEANIIKSLLETAGIDCVLVTQVPHNVYAITIDGLGEIKIKVLDHQLQDAKAVIEDYESPAGDYENTEGIPEEPSK